MTDPTDHNDLALRIWALAEADFARTAAVPVTATTGVGGAEPVFPDLMVEFVPPPRPRRRLAAPVLAGALGLAALVPLALVVASRGPEAVVVETAQAPGVHFPVAAFTPPDLGPSDAAFQGAIVLDQAKTLRTFGRFDGERLVDLVNVAVLSSEPRIGRFGLLVPVELADGSVVDAVRDDAPGDPGLLIAGYQRDGVWLEVVVPGGDEALIAAVDRALTINSNTEIAIDRTVLPPGLDLVEQIEIREAGSTLESLAVVWYDDFGPVNLGPEYPTPQALSITTYPRAVAPDDQLGTAAWLVSDGGPGLTPVAVGPHQGWQSDKTGALSWYDGTNVVTVSGSLSAEQLTRVAESVVLVDEAQFREALPQTPITPLTSSDTIVDHLVMPHDPEP